MLEAILFSNEKLSRLAKRGLVVQWGLGEKAAVVDCFFKKAVLHGSPRRDSICPMPFIYLWDLYIVFVEFVVLLLFNLVYSS